jgi:hypothetical protein
MLKRCEVIDGLIADQRGQLERLLDLYLSGEFDRSHLTDRKVRLEQTRASLEKERDALLQQVKQLALTERDVKSLQEFGDKIRHAPGSDALQTFETKARIIELLDVRARVAIEDDQRAAYVSCAIAEDRLCFHDNPTVACASSAGCKTRWACA